MNDEGSCLEFQQSHFQAFRGGGGFKLERERRVWRRMEAGKKRPASCLDIEQLETSLASTNLVNGRASLLQRAVLRVTGSQHAAEAGPSHSQHSSPDSDLERTPHVDAGHGSTWGARRAWSTHLRSPQETPTLEQQMAVTPASRTRSSEGTPTPPPPPEATHRHDIARRSGAGDDARTPLLSPFFSPAITVFPPGPPRSLPGRASAVEIALAGAPRRAACLSALSTLSARSVKHPTT